jgi:serine phosphatase RsbU (regulator of sigma subunit)
MDFREEYEAERTRWLRRRFLWYSGVLSIFYALALVLRLAGVALDAQASGEQVVGLGLAGIPQIGMFLVAYIYASRRPLARDAILRLVFALTVASGIIGMIFGPVILQLGIESEGARSSRAEVVGNMFVAMFAAHFAASLFIPWTPREAIRPFLPLLAVFFIVTLFLGGGSWIGKILVIIFAPLAGLPGYLVCLWRHSRFRETFHYRMLRRRYGDLQRELVDARRVHEALFPPPIDRGPIHFHYAYEPMRQIGGDYLYAFHEPAADGAPGRLSIVLIDVTGHGVAAALTVNRLYGELERLYAERPDLPPGEMLAALNRYVNLTLAKHSVYATALCLRADPANDRIEWANAGHPPAFIRTAGGKIDRFDSSAPLLGVLPSNEFDAGERTMSFTAGDTIVAYTDGATDAANEQGDRLRIDGLQRILANGSPPPRDDRGRWCRMLLREINQYRFGAAVDDTLLVELHRPVVPAGARTQKGSAS